MQRGAFLLAALATAVALAGCAKRPEATARYPHHRSVPGDEDPAATADALLGAWFGCAMGETWTAALDTPPHSFSDHDLSRCHAVGGVVNAPAARLRAFVPDAVAAVSRTLDDKLGEAEGLSGYDRSETLTLFQLGTDALEELAEADDVARSIMHDRAADARADATAAEMAVESGRKVQPAAHADYEPEPYRPRMVRLGRADRLAALYAFASESTSLRSGQASALAWMIVLARIEHAGEIPVDLRRADVALALEAVAGIGRPEAFTPRTTTADEWLTYVEHAASSVEAYAPRVVAGLDDDEKLAVEKDAYAALVRGLARHLRDAADPLPASELRRAALGAAEASVRGGTEVAERR